jgi:putative tryptophan/tyrosine transport system substrate-binding protein
MPHRWSRRLIVQGAGAVGLGLLAGCGRWPGQPQQPTKVPGIGFISASTLSAIAARTEAFRQDLRELGYVEGENIVIEYRYAGGHIERLSALATELVRLPVDVIVTAAPSQTRVAKEATSTIPIVMAYDSDPAGNGFVVSLARPGGNITGLSSLAPGITAKQLELLNEIVAGLSKVAVLGTSTPHLPEMATRMEGRELGVATGALGVQLQHLDVRRLDILETAFREARNGRADAALVLASPVLEAERARVAALTAQHRLRAIYHVAEFVEVGGLMSYGASWIDLYRRAAYYVDRILEGTKPADLPVEQPMRFDFIINARTAEALGLTIPPHVLLQATEVIQ